MDAATPKKPRFNNFALRDTDDALIEVMIFDHQAVLWVSGSYIEMATKLGISKIGTVKSRLHRARMALVQARAATRQ